MQMISCNNTCAVEPSAIGAGCACRNRSSGCVQVARTTQAAEAAMEAAQARIARLGPLMPGGGQAEEPLRGAARQTALDRRKACLLRQGACCPCHPTPWFSCGHWRCAAMPQAELGRADPAGKEAPDLGQYAGPGAQVLAALAQRVIAATGLPVQLRTRSEPRCASCTLLPCSRLDHCNMHVVPPVTQCHACIRGEQQPLE
jgi:hypothetical protein